MASGYPILRRRWWALLLVVLALLLAMGSLVQQIQSADKPPPAARTAASPPTVAALGRLEPLNRVIRLGPAALQTRARVERLLVAEGQEVTPGAPIALLDSHERLAAAVAVAEAKLKTAETQLARVQAGAKRGEVTAQRKVRDQLQADLTGERAKQRADLQRLASEQRFAEAEYRRHLQLYEQGAISDSLSDSKRLAAEAARERFILATAELVRTERNLSARIAEAGATLERIAEVRPVDVQLAQAEINSARAAVQQAVAELALASVVAPSAGRILKIHTRPGEVVAERGIAELGATRQMAVLAEIYQSDIARVRLGDQATITSEGFSGELTGSVVQVGQLVSVQNILANRPGAEVDRKVVEVRIRLVPADSARVAALSNLQVQVRIGTAGGGG
ncbi:HlyD family efflux transporter periplasmic adaptor subunit [Gloeobacter morelensis]|uniref:HlyD family efflux transporter periplasmic adaptor subunit n=1 Tax=Gloeobacter morelensis MG652769 TaxID=2781736 RepID=A0ABY3PNB7_9CYAN|nr:HlyD family efflux transporter periplasmic adaptor subunit [Gloeobacter morelensis]UFP95136.1 HlyD family efflux transporter periplasmic adaptor subunit [Gloeobacter morelensis MG652769]